MKKPFSKIYDGKLFSNTRKAKPGLENSVRCGRESSKKFGMRGYDGQLENFGGDNL